MIEDVEVLSFQFLNFRETSSSVTVGEICSSPSGHLRLLSTNWTTGLPTVRGPSKMLSAIGPVPLGGIIPRMPLVKGVSLA